jgi:hypothetical protein
LKIAAGMRSQMPRYAKKIQTIRAAKLSHWAPMLRDISEERSALSPTLARFP